MKRRKELASVSFHFLQKEEKSENKEVVVVPFSPAEFDDLCTGIEDQPQPDLSNDAVLERVRNGVLVPFHHVTRINSRLLTGQFQVPYSGHSFLNSEKGKIAAQSVNQRDFHFLLYLSDDGRVFIGAQYLGNYGGYETLRWGLTRHLKNRAGIRSYSFRRDVYDLEAIRAKEVIINVAKESSSYEHDNSLTKKSVIVLKREGDKDHEFEDAVREELMPILTSDIDASMRKKEIAKVLTDTGLISVSDSEIENCIMIADIGGYEKRFHFLGDSAFATRFRLEVPYNLDGHPQPEPTIKEMLKKLDKEVIEQI